MREVIYVEAMDMLSLSILVWFAGHHINARVRVLRENYIPPAVTGGLIFAAASMLLYQVFDIEL